MTLYELFERCLNISYTKLTEDADVAYERRGRALHIYFEKSANITDWKNNLDFPAACRCRDGDLPWYAHRGFLRVWESAADHLGPVIADKSIRQITVVGYSHGAALALLCHEHLWYHRPDLRNAVQGYGFGCPRVVWGMPPANRWEHFFVIRNIDDIVTHLPPSLMGYTHVGKLIRIGKKGRYSAADAHRPENISAELRDCQLCI